MPDIDVNSSSIDPYANMPPADTHVRPATVSVTAPIPGTMALTESSVAASTAAAPPLTNVDVNNPLLPLPGEASRGWVTNHKHGGSMLELMAKITATIDAAKKMIQTIEKEVDKNIPTQQSLDQQIEAQKVKIKEDLHKHDVKDLKTDMSELRKLQHEKHELYPSHHAHHHSNIGDIFKNIFSLGIYGAVKSAESHKHALHLHHEHKLEKTEHLAKHELEKLKSIQPQTPQIKQMITELENEIKQLDDLLQKLKGGGQAQIPGDLLASKKQ